MMSIFNFFGSVLGYLLWFLYTVFKNYGIAIILFTIIVKALMFPFSIKSQKSMAAQSRLASKQQELQKKYAKDQMKYNEELQKLYEKEGVNPGGGCLTTLLPFPIMLWHLLLRYLSALEHPAYCKGHHFAGYGIRF